MAGYIGKSQSVTQVDGYNRSEADAEFVQVTGDTMTGALTGTDITLSGGVYLGGTGSANLLDDYEEGTWTPTLTGSTGAPSSVTYVVRSGVYRKVGGIVHVSCVVVISAYSGGTGEWQITGLPFSGAAARSHFLTFNQNNQVTYPAGATTVTPYVIPNEAFVRARGFGSAVNSGLQLSAVPTGATFETSFNGVYTV
jgi:hypothetical protein